MHALYQIHDHFGATAFVTLNYAEYAVAFSSKTGGAYLLLVGLLAWLVATTFYPRLPFTYF